jgi:hypothetical protein
MTFSFFLFSTFLLAPEHPVFGPILEQFSNQTKRKEETRNGTELVPGTMWPRFSLSVQTEKVWEHTNKRLGGSREAQVDLEGEGGRGGRRRVEWSDSGVSE